MGGRVKVIANVVVIGAGFVRSTVGVSVDGSRVGIRACVGVASNIPAGTWMSVGGPRIGLAAAVTCVIYVGVGGRSSTNGRAAILTVPAQYKTAALMMRVIRQPYPSCCCGNKFDHHPERGGGSKSDSGLCTVCTPCNTLLSISTYLLQS